MRKLQEVADDNSCLNRAGDGEMIFVLLGRDAAAPHAIRAWAEERLRLDKNEWNDEQIQHALVCAEIMECERLAPQSGKREAQEKK